MKIKVLLLKKIPNVGNVHDIVEVSNGYALNYLVPKGLGKIPTAGDIKNAELMRKKQSQKSDDMKAKAELQKKQLQEISPLVMEAKTAGNALYGSIAERDVAEALAKKSIEIDAKQIRMTHIKTTGMFDIKISLGLGIHGLLKVHVKASS